MTLVSKSLDVYKRQEEGCLSLAGSRKTSRFEKIQVFYYDINWKPQLISLEGFAAQICQHELDHLEGILI